MIRAIYKQKKHLGAALAAAILISCSKAPQIVPVQAVSPTPAATASAQTGIITVEVSFNNTPAAATSLITPLKYDKTSVINFEFDDNPTGAYNVYQSFKTKSIPDGTGGQASFTAACAVNSKGNYNNGDLWENYQGNLTKEQAIAMVKGGWTLANHGLYHSVVSEGTNFGYGKPVAENISENTKYVFDKTGFKMRTLVVPSNDAGYLTPAFEQGIIATSSTNSFDGYQSYPAYGDYVDIALLPANKIHLRRDFNDGWDAKTLNTIKEKLTALFNKSSINQRMLYRLGTHTPDLAAFTSLAEHITDQSNGNCWVTSTQELIEYLQIKKALIKNETFSSGKLIITIDISAIDKDTFFRDFTLKINSDASVKNISVSNARKSCSNNANGLVNIGF